MTEVKTIAETIAADPVRTAELAFANANVAKANADDVLASARAVTAAARARIASPAIDDDAPTLIRAYHDANAGEALADLTREIAEGKIIAAQVALRNARDLALTPAFNEIVAARIVACEAAEKAREALAAAQAEFDMQTAKLYAIRGAGKTGIPNISEIAGRVVVASPIGREIHSASDEREFWNGAVA